MTHLRGSKKLMDLQASNSDPNSSNLNSNHPTPSAKKRWLLENEQALINCNRLTEQYGLFSKKYRAF